MKIDIRIFDFLDKLARVNNVTDAEWAKSSGMSRMRLHELRRISLVNDNENLGYHFTIAKLISLYNGLYSCIGGDLMKEKIFEALEKESDMKICLHLSVLLLHDADSATQKDVMKYIKSSVNSTSSKIRLVKKK